MVRTIRDNASSARSLTIKYKTMKKTLSKGEFIDEWQHWEQRKNQFSYEALGALFDYFEEYEESTGEEYELDIVAICCEFTEYNSLKEFQKDYGTDYESIDDIENETLVLRLDDESFIIQQF